MAGGGKRRRVQHDRRPYRSPAGEARPFRRPDRDPPRHWLPTGWPVAMSTSRGRVDSSARQVRTHVHRVALGATLLALALYLLACFVVDLVVVDRLNHEIDSRLAARLHQVIRYAAPRQAQPARSAPTAHNFRATSTTLPSCCGGCRLTPSTRCDWTRTRPVCRPAPCK